ncbi:MAG: metallophosphoesterase [Flavobacterium sp.]|nr:metallophosphoesterase [Candidatus Neoflavobacterium equi]
MKFLILIAFVLLIEWYTYQSIRVLTQNNIIRILYIVLTLIVLAYFYYSYLHFDRKTGQNTYSLYAIGVFLLLYIPKLLLSTVLLLEDVVRVIEFGGRFVFKSTTEGHFPERRKVVTLFGLGIAAIPFTNILYGMWQGRYNFRVLKELIVYKDLPAAFNGFRILQLSDIHVGSFENREEVIAAVDLINQQEFDVLFFTGDIVNSLANEMDPWYDVFDKIKTPAFGKYSILGNHDYGEYVKFDSDAEKQANFIAIQEIHKKIGFTLLKNESVVLKKNGEEIRVIGVENWGANFKQAGDLSKASAGVQKEEFKILLSHDPSHWDLQVKTHPLNYHLTLSGHTHGMQFGIEVPKLFQWSPVQYVYKYWAGLYTENERKLYVNRGFGYHGYPGRTGIWPEITLITLNNK